MLIVVASAGVAKLSNSLLLSFSGLRIATFAAEVGTSGGLGEIASIASREGFTFLIALAFVVGIWTRRIVITDPEATSELTTVAETLATLTKSVELNAERASGIEGSMASMAKSMSVMETRMESAMQRRGERNND